MSRELILVCIYRQCLFVFEPGGNTAGHTNAALYRFAPEWTLFFRTHNKSWLSNISFMFFLIILLEIWQELPHLWTELFAWQYTHMFYFWSEHDQATKVFYTYINILYILKIFTFYAACVVVMLRFMYTHKCNVHTEQKILYIKFSYFLEPFWSKLSVNWYAITNKVSEELN
jgi:hypothetical protein